MIPIANQLAAALERAQVAIQQRAGMTAGLDAEIRYVLGIYRAKRDARRAYDSQVSRRDAHVEQLRAEPVHHQASTWFVDHHGGTIFIPAAQTGHCDDVVLEIPSGLDDADDAQHLANAKRAVLCVNACNTIPDFVLAQKVRMTVLFNCNGDLLRWRTD